MSKDFSKGDKVQWKWGNGHGTGEVQEKFTSKVTRTIEGNEVTRNASDDEPAYLLKQDDGGRVLKSGSELSRSGGSSGGPSSDGKTKDELYEEAKEQDVEGRSNMNKAELKDAVES